MEPIATMRLIRSAPLRPRSKATLQLRGGGTSVLKELSAMRELVETKNACALPGCTIKYDSFLPVLRRAVSRGYVRDEHAAFVEDGLRNGFSLGLSEGDFSSLQFKKRVFRNYQSAYDGRPQVTKAVMARVARGKTLELGPWHEVKNELDATVEEYFKFPMGAVAKPTQPSVLRPTDDHTVTGLNGLTILGLLAHTLNTYKEAAWLLKQNYFMYVSDVEDAFLLIPLAPWLWRFFLFSFFRDDAATTETTFVHLFGDFGTRGMPGTFKIFLVDVVIQMARSEMVITIPLVVYVDDVGGVSGDEEFLNMQMSAFQAWTALVCGILWKIMKDRKAAQLQYYIGFWWDSQSLTRSLEEKKLLSYLDVLLAAAHSTSLTLKERQSLGGKMQRAAMTMPPGARCLIVCCYAMMCRLTLPWHSRRTSREERQDYLLMHDLLKLNMGRGHYSFDLFKRIGPAASDACKSRDLTASGWHESGGSFDYFKYGAAASRRLIDELEGDTVLRCCLSNAAKWNMCIVPFGIDNKSFQGGSVAGRSRAPRLNDILRGLFTLQIKENFILDSFWLSSEDNILSDDLSRFRIGAFLARFSCSPFLGAPVSQIRAVEGAGRTATFDDDQRGTAMHALRQTLKTYSSNFRKDHPNRGKGVGGDAQLLSLSFHQCSLLDGLPLELEERFDEVMDNRLAPSSKDKMMSGFSRWSKFCDEHGWSPFIETGDRMRGGRMVAWVLSMLDDTSLAFASITTYMWGMRSWMVMQHQADPAHGVMHWREFMRSVATLSSTVGEPRQMVPLETVRAILEVLDPEVAEDAQLGLLILTLLFSFTRTECPCPKTFSTGRDPFDPQYHWTVGDFKLLKDRSGSWVLWVRFKGIKQDPRIERPSARTAVNWLPFEPESDGRGRDWVPLGDVGEDSIFSVARWYKAFARAVGRQRSPDEPMFLARDMERPYTYGCLLSDFKKRVDAVGGKGTPHGLRALGYNLSKRGNGVDLTVAHGGWFSEAHSRYERFEQRAVLGIPAGMLGMDSSFGEADSPREITRRRGVRGGKAQGALQAEPMEYDASEEDEDEEPVQVQRTRLDVGMPPGYVRERRERASEGTPGRSYVVWRAPDGRSLRSRPEAWRHYAARQAVEPDTAAVESQEVEEENVGLDVPLLFEEAPEAVVPPATPEVPLRARRVSVGSGGTPRGFRSPRVSSPLAAVAGVPAAEQQVEFLEDVVVDAARPSRRRAPAARSASE